MKLSRLLLLTLLAFSSLSFGQRKEYVELQRDVALLQDQVRSLQTSMNEKLAALQVLVQQTLDASNKANTAVAVLESGFRDRLREQEKSVAGPVAGVNTKLDQFSEEFRALRETVGDMNARMGKLQAQIVDLGNAVKVMQSPPPPPGPGAAGGPPPSGVSADQLYQSAMRDRSSGSLDLALQEFNQYLQYFPSTDLAPNAQFYVGMIYYDKGDLESSIKAFDLVVEKFGLDNNKTADAMYMKGMALLKMDQRNAAVQEFREVIKRFPRTDLADKSRERLKGLGVSAAPPASKSSSKKRR